MRKNQKSEDRTQKGKNLLNLPGITHYALRILSFVFVYLSFAGIALAAEPAAHAGAWKEWAWKILNFAILVFILVKFLGKPLREFLRKRTELIEKTLNEAKEAKELAAKALAEVEERLKLKDKEMDEILAQSRKSAGHEHELLIQQGEQMKEKLLEQAKNNIDYELQHAKETLKAEAVEIAIELAEKRLKEKLSADRQKWLMEESLSMLEAKK